MDNNFLPFLQRKDLDFEPGTTFSIIVDLYTTTISTYVLRGFTKAGSFRYPLITVAQDSIQTFRVQLDDIPIAVSLTCEDSTDTAATAYAKISLGVNTDRMVAIAQGLVGFYNVISWPFQQASTPDQALGQYVDIFGANPAAGADSSDLVPNNQCWELMCASIILVTDANAANRLLTLLITLPNGTQIRRISATNQTATTTINYSFIPGGTTALTVTGAQQEVALPTPIVCPAGTRFQFIITNKQVGDNLSQTSFVVRKRYTNLSSAGIAS